MGLNSESETSNPGAGEPRADAPSPEDQGPALSAAKEPNGARVDQAGAEATEPPPSPKKPKRKYRSSDKVRASSPANLKQARKAYVFTPARRAASMKNLEKANAAPPEKRNRFTPRRQLAWYANLCLAHLKLGPPGKRGPTHIYNGATCRHLEHSLALAGEDKAKLDAHRDRFQRAFRPRDREGSRFVRGMADSAWRLLRVLGVRARWEMRAVQFRLMLAINWRQSGRKLEAGDARQMAAQLLEDLADVVGLYEEAKRLRKRLEQLLRAFLSHRMGAPSSFHFVTGEGSRLPDFEHMPDFALSNPFLWPGLAEKLAEQEAAGAKKLKDPKDWKGQPKEGEEKARSAKEGLSDEEKVFRHQLLQAGGFKDDLDQVGLERMLGLAFGIDDCELETGNSKIETRVAGNPAPVADCPGSESGDSQQETPGGGRVSSFEFPVSSSQSSIRELAATLWARLGLFPDWRDRQAQEMDETLEQASGPHGVQTWEPQPPPGSSRRLWQPELEDESPHWQWRALAALLLAVFMCDVDWLDEAGVLSRQLYAGLYRFLVWHYQEGAGFDAPQPEEKYAWDWPQPGTWAIYLRAQYANGVRMGTGFRV